MKKMMFNILLVLAAIIGILLGNCLYAFLSILPVIIRTTVITVVFALVITAIKIAAIHHPK